jgi:hypothetical protein
MKFSYNCFLLILLVISIILFNSFTKTKTGFQNYNSSTTFNTNSSNWSPGLIKRFNIYQTTISKNITHFDLEILQKQATPLEVEHLLETGYWPWSEELQNEYLNKVLYNKIIKIEPKYALDYAMKTYNRNAARELLAWNSKEGQFLLYGGVSGTSEKSGTSENNGTSEKSEKSLEKNTIKCSTDSNGNSVMEKTVFNGMNLWNGYNTSVVKPEDIPKEMPGFTFVNNPCDPCVALNSPGDFSCPFKLNIKGDDSISNPWKSLWGL